MNMKAPTNNPPLSLNTKIRPQDDFFGYVNSKWLKANPIPPDERSWGHFQKLRLDSIRAMHEIYEDLQKQTSPKQGSVAQQARDLYYTGMNFSKFEKQHLALINEWFAEIDDINNTNDLSAVLGKLQSIGVDGPWRIILDADDKDSTKHILRFDQSGLALPDRDYYLQDNQKMHSIRIAYTQHMEKVHTFFPSLAVGAPKIFVASVYKFEERLAKISRSSIELRDLDKNYNKVTYKQLQADYPNINWPLFAKGCGWRPDNKICVDQPEFMKFVNDQFVEMPLREWKSYLKWRLLLIYMARISQRFADLRFEFFGKVIAGLEELPPIWKRVSSTIDDAMGEAVGKLYAEKHFDESSKQKMLHLVENLRAVYANRIANLDWMSAPAKKEALKKLASFKVLIGYPDKWRDFSGLKIGRESYIANKMAAESFNNRFYLNLLHKPVDRDEWHMYPQTVNAYHDYNRLVICFPAAILQPPFFHPDWPDAANYGAIGSVIGHEMTHGFDDQGGKFDSIGNAKNWQTKSDHVAFKKRAQLIIDQANNFEVLPGLNLRGELVIGESIADLGGVEIAYDAYQKSLGKKPITKEQSELFFISYATGECGTMREETRREITLTDPHPDSRFRVNAILSHIDAFYDTFKLTKGDKLFREPPMRAKIW